MTAPDADVAVASEKRSLAVAMWANVVMGVAGVTAAQLSNSDALMVDGLYSGVNFFSALIAARVAASVMKPADQQMPFGYDANEALYVLFRSLVLLGILVFAGFNSLHKIISYLGGGSVPELVFGPIAIYMVFMVLICFGLAACHHYHWRQTGCRSEILKTERTASVVDGVISLGAGGALLGVTLLRGTPAEGIIPISDAIIVLVLVAFIMGQPYGVFRGAIKEVAGKAMDEETTARVRQRIERVTVEVPCELLAVAVTKLGRSHFIIAYVRPDDSVVAENLDVFRKEVQDSCDDLFGRVKSEVIFTAAKPF
jgi:divalent metal cation (Fe/Co/Zn/Cd) transporter